MNKLEYLEGEMARLSAEMASVMKVLGIGQAPVIAKKVGRPLGSTNRKHKPHKLHLFKYSCEICGKSCRGKRGLGAHKALQHGIPSPRREDLTRRMEMRQALEKGQLLPNVAQLLRVPVTQKD